MLFWEAFNCVCKDTNSAFNLEISDSCVNLKSSNVFLTTIISFSLVSNSIILSFNFCISFSYIIDELFVLIFFRISINSWLHFVISKLYFSVNSIIVLVSFAFFSSNLFISIDSDPDDLALANASIVFCNSKFNLSIFVLYSACNCVYFNVVDSNSDLKLIIVVWLVRFNSSNVSIVDCKLFFNVVTSLSCSVFIFLCSIFKLLIVRFNRIISLL